MEYLMECMKEGRDSILGGIRELKEAQLVLSLKVVDIKTRNFVPNRWIYTDTPGVFNISKIRKTLRREGLEAINLYQTTSLGETEPCPENQCLETRAWKPVDGNKNNPLKTALGAVSVDTMDCVSENNGRVKEGKKETEKETEKEKEKKESWIKKKEKKEKEKEKEKEKKPEKYISGAREESGFFPEYTLEQIQGVSKYLSKIIERKKKIKHTITQVTNWQKPIIELITKQGVSIDRIKTAMKWYSIHIGDPYVPVIESGTSLREKFLKLENAIERDKQPVARVNTVGHISDTNHKYRDDGEI